MNLTITLFHVWLAAWVVSGSWQCAALAGWFVIAMIIRGYTQYRLRHG